MWQHRVSLGWRSVTNFSVGCVLAILTLNSPLCAQTDIVRIEEHWELSLTQSDSQTNAPQVMMHFSPFGQESGWHFELDLNHASLPVYTPGGFQVRAMRGDQLVSDVRLLADDRLASSSELLTWVQIAQKQPTGWAFAIGYGNSTSWGNFGGPETVVTLPASDLTLNYSPADSLQNSGVVYAKNRVERLTLRKIRIYTSNGQMQEVLVGQSVL
jgi:hypothetical protein